MRFASALALRALVLGTGVLVGQTAPSAKIAREAATGYRLDDGIGAVAFYPGEGYRSFVETRFLVSSLDELESQMSQVPRGAALHWLPHRWDNTGNPLLFKSGQFEQLVRFCGDHGIQLLVERTYRPRLDADGSYSRTVVAPGDKGRTPLEFRSVVVHLASNARRAKDYILRMLYDPKTKLFYWSDGALYQGYGPEGEANLSDQWLASTTIFVASDQMVIFGLAVGRDASLGIVASTRREISLDQGQASAIHALERKTATPFRRSNRVTYGKQLPPHFFEQCITDIDMPFIQSVVRQKKGWQVTVAAQNGNTATLSLDDSYNLISTKIALNPSADSVGGCKR